MTEAPKTPDCEDPTCGVNLIALSSAIKVSKSLLQPHFDVTQKRSLLDETIVEESPTRVVTENAAAGSENGYTETVMELSSAIKETALEDDAAFFLKTIAEQRQDVELLSRQCKELLKEKLEFELLLRERNDECILYRNRFESVAAELEHICQDRDNEFSILEAERQELQAKCDDCIASVAAMKAERDEANSECEKLFMETHALHRQIRNLEHLQSAKDCLQEKFDDLQKAYEELRQHQSHGDASSISVCNTNDDAAAQLQEKVEGLELQLARKEEELADFRSAALEQARDAEAEFAKRDDEIVRLEQDLSQAQERIRLLKESAETFALDNLDHLSSERNERIQELELANQSLQEQLVSANERNEHLNDLVNRLEKACDDADVLDEEYRDKIASLEATIQQVEAEKKLLATSAAMADRANLEIEIAQKKALISQLEELLGDSQNECRQHIQKLRELEDKYRAVCKKIKCLQKDVSTKGDSNAASAPEAARSGGALVISGGSSIVETGRVQLLESQSYQLRKQLENAQKENSRLLEENKQLRSSSNSLQSQDKENYSDRNSSSKQLRRATSESDNNSSRPLREFSTPNSPAGQLFTTTSSEAVSRSRLFPPLEKN